VASSRHFICERNSQKKRGNIQEQTEFLFVPTGKDNPDSGTKRALRLTGTPGSVRAFSGAIQELINENLNKI